MRRRREENSEKRGSGASQTPPTLKDAVRACGALLQRQDYTEARLSEKLRSAGFPEELVCGAVQAMKEAGYVNDARYADTFISQHAADRSRARILQDLVNRGVDKHVAEEALAGAAEAGLFAGKEEAQIRALLQKRGFHPETATYEEKQKTMAFLYRKGYAADLIRKLVRE